MANSRCVKFSKCILTFINCIFFTMGALIAGMAGYLLANGASLGFDASAQKILSPSALYVGIAFGAIICIISIMGCVSSFKAGRCGKFFLTIYSIVVGTVILAELSAGAAVLVVSGKIGAMKGTDIANKTDDAFEKIVGEFIQKTFTKCCVTNATTGTTEPDTSDVVCKALNSVLGDRMCSSEKKFKDAAINWIMQYTKPIGVACIIVAIIELLCIFAACHITCHAQTPEQEQVAEIKKQREQQQQAGGDLAYGGASGKPLAGGQYA